MTAETYEYTVDEFMELIHGELEARVDELIAAEPAEHRFVLMAHREEILAKYVEATRQANIQHRLTPQSDYKH